MEWRCEWCGKPHPEDDPPCDNCGHSKFEKAVVQQTDLSEAEREPAIVWVCTDCGREHPKNNPPCSRCGALDFERRRQQIDESELSAPGYLDLLTPRYVAAAAVTAGLVVVFALGVTGVVDVPGFGGQGAPAVQDVPGNATDAGPASLAAVESEFTDRLNRETEASGELRVERSASLDDVARYRNQRYVKAAYDGTGGPADGRLRDIDVPDGVREAAGDACGQDGVVIYSPVASQQTGDLTAETLAEGLAERFRGGVRAGSLDGTQIGVDAHEGPDGAVWLLVVACQAAAS